MEKRVIGGVFLIISAIVGIIYGFWMMAVAWWLEDIADVPGVAFGPLGACGGIVIVFAIISLIGAVAALKGTSWPLALVGGICALVAGWFIFGLIGLIFIAIAKDEFYGEAPPPGAYGAPPPGAYPPPGQYPPPGGYPPQQPPPGGYPPQQPPPGAVPPQQPPMEQAPPPEMPPQQPPAQPPAEP